MNVFSYSYHTSKNSLKEYIVHILSIGTGDTKICVIKPWLHPFSPLTPASFIIQESKCGREW